MSGTSLVSLLAPNATTTAPNQPNMAFALDNNLRMVSLSIAAYDYIITLPAEFRLYRSSSRRSVGLILFVLIRYTSVIVLFTSNFGFLYHHFTPKACSYYGYIAPIFKVIQLMVSQAILGVRTYNITQRSTWVFRTIVSAYLLASVLLWFTTLYDRQADMTDGNCMIASAHPDQTISAWFFYLIAMLYDFLVLGISTRRLLKLRENSASSVSDKLLNILLYDGLGFFVALTAINLANLLLYRHGGTTQTSGASLEYAVIFIMSQRVLIHLREERVRQESVMASQIPRASPPQLYGPRRSRPDGSLVYDTTPPDSNAGVRVLTEQISDAKPVSLDGESGTTVEQDIFARQITIHWNETTGKGSQV